LRIPKTFRENGTRQRTFPWHTACVERALVTAKAWDRTMALAFVGGDQALLSELLAIFVADAPVHLAALREAIGHAHAGQIARISHMLKGELRTLGAAAAAAQAEELEELADEGAVDAAQVLALYTAFEGQLTALYAQLTNEDRP